MPFIEVEKVEWPLCAFIYELPVLRSAKVVYELGLWWSKRREHYHCVRNKYGGFGIKLQIWLSTLLQLHWKQMYVSYSA